MSEASHPGLALPRPIWRKGGVRFGVPWPILALLIALSGAVAIVMVMSDGNLMIGCVLIGLVALIAVTVYRVDWGFYIFVFFTLFFDQYDIPGFPTITTDVGYFLNLNAIRWMPTFDQGVVTPMELQLLLIFSLWIITSVLRGSFNTSSIALKGPMALLFVAIIVTVGQGLARGGDTTISLWETRALFYMGLMIVFVPQIVKTGEQLKTLMWVVIAGVSFKAFQGAFRFASLGFSFGRWPDIYETLTNHEDPVFMVTLMILLLAMVLFGDRSKQRRALTWLLIPMFVGYVAAQRRAAYASLMASLVTFIILIPPKPRKMILTSIGVFALFFSMYLGVFWNSYSRLGSVAQQFKATVTDEAGVRGDKDVKSTLYRKIENFNLGQTFQASPIAGIGFGRKYDKVMTMWGSSFALGDYVAHNQILWIFVEMGAVGAFFFWMFFNAYVFRSSMVFWSIADPYLKALCAMCIISVINQLVVSYVDMQLTYYRNMVYLGLMMSLVPVIQQIDQAKRKEVFDPVPPTQEG